MIARLNTKGPKAAPSSVRVSSFTSTGRLLQRKCACGGTPGPTGECEERGKKRLQRKASQPSTFDSKPAEVPPIVHEVLRLPGQPLDTETRAFMEPRFGHDFSQVRVHTGAHASESAQALNAIAYTGNSNIVFAEGHYQPASNEGRRLLAHELAHVVQQHASVGLKDALGQAGDAYERHAEAVANLVVDGKQAEPLLDQIAGSPESHAASVTGARLIHNAGPAIQMQPKPKSMAQSAPDIPGFRQMIAKWAAIDKIKSPMIRALAKEYVNRPGRIELADRVVYDTPYGGDRVIPGIHHPTEDRVYYALMPVINLKKIGRGDKATDWSFEWATGPAAEKKPAGKKGTEVGKFAGEQAISKIIDKKFAGEQMAKSAAKLGVVGAESLVTGQISGTSIAEAISEPVARWIMKDVLLVSAEVATRAIPIIGWLWLTYDVADLLISLSAPAERELSPYPMESASIVAGVKAYLQGQEDAADYKKRRSQPSQISIRNPIDKAAVSMPHR